MYELNKMMNQLEEHPFCLCLQKQHMLWKGNFFHTENNTAILAHPMFCINLCLSLEIHTTIELSTNKATFNEATAIPYTHHNSTPSNLNLILTAIPTLIPDQSMHQQF